ncbi:hypothetical protein [Halalkalicoccus tibetensis]|uniref:Uncharacterized protein n=1 Tax=Halalkalicoccus tibetensis TaxID=175632 RepID=A0ABD5V9M4_9EURY
MTTQASTDDYLTNLLSGSTTFPKIAADFDNESDCFDTLRNAAKTSLDSFDDYLAFYNTCLKTDSTGTVETFVEDNASRMLKNMVLRDSQAGRRYHITTAAELNHRIEAFQSINVEHVSPRSVVFTILEHLVDAKDDPERIYELVDALFTETPDLPTETIELLAQIRFAAAMQSFGSDMVVLNPHIERFFTDMPDRRQDDDRSADDILEAAVNTPYADPEKVGLQQTGLARLEQPDLDVVADYLYLNGRDIVERYRHKSRENPWRGELQLASWQLQTLVNCFEDRMSDERVLRAKSYQKLASGELQSSRQWQSQRDPRQRPDPNFMGAARDFISAAEYIKPIDANRYVKYMSRAFRSQAVAVRQPDRGWGPARGWESSRQLHETAIGVLCQLDSEFEEDKTLQETILLALSSHKFRGNQAAAVAAFEYGDLDRMQDHIVETRDHLDRMSTDVNEDLLYTLDELAEAIRLEDAREFDAALRCYRNVSSPHFSLRKREALVEIKQKLVSGSEDAALKKADDVFGSGSPVLTAVQVVAGRSGSSPSIKPPVMENLSGVDPNTLWRFATFAHLVSSTEGSDMAISAEMRELLLDL